MCQNYYQIMDHCVLDYIKELETKIEKQNKIITILSDLSNENVSTKDPIFSSLDIVIPYCAVIDTPYYPVNMDEQDECEYLNEYAVGYLKDTYKILNATSFIYKKYYKYSSTKHHLLTLCDEHNKPVELFGCIFVSVRMTAPDYISKIYIYRIPLFEHIKNTIVRIDTIRPEYRISRVGMTHCDTLFYAILNGSARCSYKTVKYIDNNTLYLDFNDEKSLVVQKSNVETLVNKTKCKIVFNNNFSSTTVTYNDNQKN